MVNIGLSNILLIFFKSSGKIYFMFLLEAYYQWQ